MRIALDIDSTLHHYWDVLSEVSVRRFGIELPYEEQLTWGLTRLRPEQLELCVKESHSDTRILAGVPYPGAVETVRALARAGPPRTHPQPPRSGAAGAHRSVAARRSACPSTTCTARSERVELCAREGIELLIDDSPLSIVGALERGIVAATIVHPWNEEVCEEEDVICRPRLARARAPAGAAGRRARLASV